LPPAFFQPEVALLVPAILFFAMVLISGLFAAAETALLSLTSYHVKHLRSSRKKRVHALEQMLKNPDEALLTILTIRIGARMLAIAFALTLGYRAFPKNPLSANLAAGIIALIGVVVISEFIARFLVASRSAAVAPNLARIVRVIIAILFPVQKLVRAILVRKNVNGRSVHGLSEEYQLRALIEAGEVEGLLNERERTIIDNILEFRESTADEIMWSRPEIEALPDTLTQKEILERLRQTRHSRIPLYHETVDSIVAVLHSKEVLLNPNTDYHQLQRQPLFIPPKRALTDLLADFQNSRVHLAIVVDEYGGVSGLVTLADLLQEIISAFAGDEDEEEFQIRRVGPNRWIVRGECEVHHLNEELGADLPDTTSRTVGGFVTALLGRFPQPQEEVRYQNLLITILKMETHRVRLLRVQIADEETDGHDQQSRSSASAGEHE
jgi:putative hemolysin